MTGLIKLIEIDYHLVKLYLLKLFLSNVYNSTKIKLSKI